MEIKVARILRYPIMAGGRIDKSREPEVIRSKAKVSTRYIEEVNSRTDENGLFIQVDTKATEKYIKEAEKVNEQRAKEAELKSQLAASNLAEALGVKKPTPKRKKAEPKKEEPKND